MECYFLRLLLHHISGPTSFADLRVVNCVCCSNYRAACLTLGLIEDDNHLHSAITEAANCQSPQFLRRLFAIILTSCEPADLASLWTQHRESLAEDYFRDSQFDNELIRNSVFNDCLIRIEDLLIEMGGQSLESYDLQLDRSLSELRHYQVFYAIEEQIAFVDEHERQLTNEQDIVYQQFLSNVNTKSSGIVFLDAPGGTCKTFLINLILAKLRSQHLVALATVSSGIAATLLAGGRTVVALATASSGIAATLLAGGRTVVALATESSGIAATPLAGGRTVVALAAASSGIAATLLAGGRTVHSTFKVPLNIHQQDTPTCSIKKGTTLAKTLSECRAIIVDEAPMTHKVAFEAIDRSLQDIFSNTAPFGGIPTLLC